MNKKLFLPLILLLMSYIILYPTNATNVVVDTLSLWYLRVLPALFPTLILVNMFLQSGCSFKKAELICMLTGICCGFPIGAVLATNQMKQGNLSKETSLLYATLFNQFSLPFLITYVSYGILHTNAIEFVAIVYLTQVFLLVLGKIYYKNKQTFTLSGHQKNETLTTDVNYKVVDVSIINSCEVLIKIFGYMVLCNLINAFLFSVTKNEALYALFAPLLEVTGGIHSFTLYYDSEIFCKTYALISVTFGGLSGLFQVSHILKQANISVMKYLLLKLVSCMLTGTVGYLYFTFITP